MSEATDAIKTIKDEFPKYANDIYIISKTTISQTDPNYDFTNPANNETVTKSNKISAFTKDVNENDLKKISDAVGANVVDKKVKKFTFYSDSEIVKTNLIEYKNKSYEIIYISEIEMQNTRILYKCIGAY